MSIEKWPVPSTWSWGTLGDLASWASGGTPKSTEPAYYGGEIPWLIIGDLNDSIVNDSLRNITILGLENSSAKMVKPGAVLIAMYGSIGKLGIAGISCATNQAIAFTEAISPALHRDFLFYFLKFIRPDLLMLGKGGAQANISQSILKEVPVCLPPSSEQRRILAKLKALLAKVDSSRKRLERIPTILKRFRQAVLAAACDGRLTQDWREKNLCSETASDLVLRMQSERKRRWETKNANRRFPPPEPMCEEDLSDIPETWTWTNFDHCSWEITVGFVGPMRDRYTPSGISFLRSQNVRPLRYDPAGLVFIPDDFHRALAKSVLSGDEILVVRSGANTGDCCVFPADGSEANCADLVVTRPLSGLVPTYGAAYVASPQGQAHLALRQTGIAQPHFNIGSMRVKPFPLPPFEEQQEIVRRIDDLHALADQIEARYLKAKAQVDRLTQSILAKAFRGELVPQDPTDEPAEALLARIRSSEPATKPSKPRGRPAKPAKV